MKANHEAGCDAIKRAVDAAILAGAWRAYNAGVSMSARLHKEFGYSEELEAWHEDAENLRIILQERSEGP